jgi:hypothetical protein
MAKSKAGKRSKKLSTKRRSVKDLSASKAQGVKGGFAGEKTGIGIKFSA